MRENHVYCQIEPPGISIAAIKELQPEGIILSGGPASIYSKGAPRVDKGIFNLGIPILGICYGLQYMVDSLGGKVIGSQKREYGFAELLVKIPDVIFTACSFIRKLFIHGKAKRCSPTSFSISVNAKNRGR